MQTTFCVFDPFGQLQEVVRLKVEPGTKPHMMFAQAIERWPAGTMVGTYESQEMLPASKLDIVVGHARMLPDGNSFRVNTMEEIEDKLRAQAIRDCEAAVVHLCAQVSSTGDAMVVIGEYASDSLEKRFQALVSERDRLAKIVRRELPLPIKVDENLARIVGECFAVTLDHSRIL